MRVLVTRPLDEAARWVQSLARHGIEAISLPLIEIQPLADRSAIDAAWQSLPRYAAVMFVSAPAVRHFFADRPEAARAWSAGALPRAWAPGPGTAAALVALGVPASRIDAPAQDSGQFDSEALWRQIASTVRSGQQVLVVRGSERDAAAVPGPMHADRGQGRDWLARRLIEQGAQVEFVVAYRRAAPAPQQLRQAIADAGVPAQAVWLFTSSQAIDNLTRALPGHDWSTAQALVTHPRIGAAARAAGFGVVRESRPALADVVSSIKSAP